MIQFLGMTLLLIIAAGLAIHAGVQLPWFIEWFGTLPGDIIIKKGSLTLYLPVTSSVLVSAALSIVLSLFSRK
ncbi:MAG: DUF2905 family protein [Verrucomicrobia bacterium]|nr:DUF2905 family protein [Verrucomicrobiota bacterium]MBU6446794.1 DUF2905 family protein [Verrucomicrobiota bacterium]MDE3048198.1 DUF2905 domain-containing protein [Verrucomicrobiota bacterium]